MDGHMGEGGMCVCVCVCDSDEMDKTLGQSLNRDTYGVVGEVEAHHIADRLVHVDKLHQCLGSLPHRALHPRHTHDQRHLRRGGGEGVSNNTSCFS